MRPSLCVFSPGMSAGIAMAASGSNSSARSQQQRANERLFNRRGPSGRNYCDDFIEKVLRFVVARFSSSGGACSQGAVSCCNPMRPAPGVNHARQRNSCVAYLLDSW
jgi:hypothetical protein